MIERPEVEVWFRNPRFYIEQLVESGANNTSWDGGYIFTRRIKLFTFMKSFYGNDYWRALVIQNDGYAQLYDATDPEIKAVFPVWSAAVDTWKMLRLYVENPWGQSPSTISEDLQDSHRPRVGQAHVIVITDLPSLRTREGKDFIMDLSDVQAANPQVTFFIHGTYSSRTMFGLDFRMGDVDAREPARKGDVILPTGTYVGPTRLKGASYWPNLLGFHQFELSDPKQRCLFNIRSYLWSGMYYRSLRRFGIDKNPDNPALEKHLKENNVVFTKRVAAREGDRLVCSDCSLWLHCKWYREEAVCALPKTDMAKLADMFGTRDSDRIIDALGGLLKVQMERAEVAVGNEKIEKEGIDPNLTKLLDGIFKSGAELLQIVDPEYRKGVGAPKKIGLTLTGEVESDSTEELQRKLTAQAIEYLESRGHKREEITAEMVQQVIQVIMEQQKTQKALPA